jgi:hypothetical protein
VKKKGKNDIYTWETNFFDHFYVIYMREIGKRENSRRKEDG